MYFASPEDAANAFCKALEGCDLETLMAVWGSGEDLVCIHPGGNCLIGHKAIYDSWQKILGQHETRRLKIDASTLMTWSSAFISVQTSLEVIYVGNDQTPRGPLLVTRVFMNGRSGWRLVSYQATKAGPSESYKILKETHSLH